MAETGEKANKFGLPGWIAALLAVCAGAGGVTATAYEKIRIPSLDARIALLERELDTEKLRTKEAGETVGRWKTGLEQWKTAYEELSSAAKKAPNSDACSTAQLIRELRSDKGSVEVALHNAQVEQNATRVTDLKRQASDYQAQILALSRCEK